MKPSLEIESLCKKLKPIFGSQADNLWHMYLAEDDYGRKKLALEIEIIAEKYLKQKSLSQQKILLEPPPEKNSTGTFLVGDIFYNEKKFNPLAKRFFDTRKLALSNTEHYLSMVGDLDIYVATSMRIREDFRHMADVCNKVFLDKRLTDLNLRYFDPTLSAAQGHEDKGLIECLMVKCARVLVYCAEDRDSYGKDAEAAMALCLGKPVIFYCSEEQRKRFYKDVHPLSRLVEFETGVAVGAIITSSLEDVIELLRRIFENEMEYILEQTKPGYIRLKEKLTDSVVRLQTNNRLLTETFWNQYLRKG